MGAMARQQRRLLGVGGSRISLAGVRRHDLRGQRHLRRPAAGRPGRRDAVRDAALRRRSGPTPRSPGWALAVSGVFSSFALVAVVALGAVVSGSGLAVVSAAVGVLGGAVPLGAPAAVAAPPGTRGGCWSGWARGWSRARRRSAASRRATPRRSSRSSSTRSPRWSRTARRCGSPPCSRRSTGPADAACLAFAVLAVGGRRAVARAAAGVGGGDGGGVAGAHARRPRRGRGHAELGADRDGTGRVDGDRGRARLPDREPVAGARGGRADAAGARRPEARPVRDETDDRADPGSA